MSIPANIAEGCGRGSDTDFGRFIQIAIGSTSELQYHFLLAQDLGFLDARAWADVDDELAQIKRMLMSLITYLKSGPTKPQRPEV